MPDYTVVCCVSDHDLFERLLLDSTCSSIGGRHVEFLPILNERNQYSAAQACNVGLEHSRSELVIVAHQDVRLRPGWFDLLEAVLPSLPADWAVLAAAGIDASCGPDEVGRWGGALNRPTVAVGQVWDSDDARSPYWDGAVAVTPIHAADECLMVIDKSKCLKFDDRFDGFHFYGIDYSLQARAAGYGVYGAALPITHYGKYSASMTGKHRYWTYLRYLHNKWKLLFPDCYTTHMHWTRGQLTSYIPMALEAEDGKIPVKVRAAGLSGVSMAGDHNWRIT